MRRHRIASWLAAVALAAGASAGLAACGGDDGEGGGVTAASTTPTQMPTGGEGGAGGGETTGGASAGGQDLSAQVSAGEQVFSDNCASCHGDQGQGGNGPPLIGSEADLSSHGDGAGLLDYISENMPASAPGSLSEQQYLDVTAYILDQNGALSGEALTRDSAPSVSLGGGG